MGGKRDRIQELEQQVSELLRRQFELQKSIKELNFDIKSLRLDDEYKDDGQPFDNKPDLPPETLSYSQTEPSSKAKAITSNQKDPNPVANVIEHLDTSTIKKPTKKVNWEKIIGENIINKIGIIITVIGVAIGVSYVIEHDLISPVARILIGYGFSFGLVGIAYRLREKYLNYSSVLMGGAMASMYFVTYAAFAFYSLIPQLISFISMTVITLVTVGTAIGYNKQWISVIGLVGGYAVPFLIGDENGSTTVLFSYVLFINLGVLTVAIYKYWRTLFLSAFAFTWLIFLSWFSSESAAIRDVELSLLFSTLYFLIFYSAFLVYKVRAKAQSQLTDISALLTNSTIYFGIGFGTLSYNLDYLQGAFTVALAGIHFIVGRILKKYELPTHSFQNFVNGLVLVFITLAIPIQFSEYWITMAWSLEAVLLLWLGRVKRQWLLGWTFYGHKVKTKFYRLQINCS